HLVVPVGLLVATLIGAARRRASPEQPARTAFIAFAALVVLAEWSGRNIAQMTYGVSLTMLTAFCALGAQWRVVVEPLSTSAFARLAALASVAAVAPYALVGFGVRLPDVPVLVPLAIVGGVAAAALLRPGWKAALVTVASLTLASVLLRSEFQ